MSPPEPLVSVVIPVYNGAAFLDEAVASVVSQTHRRLEILLVDDGSTDGSLELAGAWEGRDRRVRVIQGRHRGPQDARNAGVAEATGAFVAHLDQDNVAASTRIAIQLAWMKAHAVDVCGSCTRVFGDERYLGWVPERHDDILRESVFRCALVHSTAMVTAAIAKAYPFDRTRACGGDELLMRLSANYRVGNVPQPLVKYRHHRAQRAAVEAEAIRADRRVIRREAFARLCPEADDNDTNAIMRVCDGVPFEDAGERARAARWMDLLSQTEDRMLHRLMTERWSAVAGHS